MQRVVVEVEYMMRDEMDRSSSNSNVNGQGEWLCHDKWTCSYDFHVDTYGVWKEKEWIGYEFE